MATSHQLQELGIYTACDIADALVKLKIPNAGFLPDLKLFAPPSTAPKGSKGGSNSDVLVAPASTVLFAPKTGDTSGYVDANIPSGKHFVDLTKPDTIVVMQQPQGQKCAILGGIMALRMEVLNAKGIVVNGRVRDIEELGTTALPIWGKATSVVGSGLEAKAHAVQVPLDIDGTVVRPGDLVFSDFVNGVVVIPQDKVEELLALLPDLVEADDRVKEDVEKGMTVQEAFKKHRG
ncbi:hypothetical protein LZ554_006914 [Drepanopeziza brunnea f. sp. 'monogermtubi']|nr:hypothetical protein LZ554_006914 [Drepanopeziza brunnea f. sp. 'monogermtubi']